MNGENTPLLQSISSSSNNHVENTSVNGLSSEGVDNNNVSDILDTENKSDLIRNNDRWENSIIKVYKRRWYILFISGLINCWQCYLTNTWPVIAVSIKPIFGWSNATISLMQNWYSAMFLLLIFPLSWLIEAKGMRIPMVLTSGSLFAATALRCISLSPPSVTWLNNVANCLVGCAQPVAYIVGPIISAIWFPPNERVTCTSIVTTSSYLGYALCFIIGPLFASTPVPVKNYNSTHATHKEYANLGIIKGEIRNGRIMECVVCGLTFLATLIYFPNKPPKPPSNSSALPKLDFFYGIKSLFSITYANFWLICFASSISAAIYSNWVSLLTINLRNFFTQVEIGYMGFAANIVGIIAAIFIGRIGDLCLGKRKLVMMLLVCTSVFVTYWILLMSMNYIQMSKTQMYIAIIFQGIVIIGPSGLQIEMGIESNYPVDEIVTTGAIMITYNIFPFVFLLVFLIPNIGTAWMNWFLYISLIFCVPLVYLFKDKYRRIAVDIRDSLIVTTGSGITGPLVTTVE